MLIEVKWVVERVMARPKVLEYVPAVQAMHTDPPATKKSRLRKNQGETNFQLFDVSPTLHPESRNEGPA